MATKKSQNETIKQHLESGASITSWQAIVMYRITRLSGRIYDLKNDYDMDIHREMIKVNGVRVAEYSLQN